MEKNTFQSIDVVSIKMHELSNNKNLAILLKGINRNHDMIYKT